jgi:hypothetical protein
MELLVLFLLGGGFAVLISVARHQRAERRAAAATVSFAVDDWGVRRSLADGRYEEVSWDELVEVRATTLPRGPWDERVRFILDGGGERGCIVAYDVADQGGLVPALAALPGFDHRLLAEVLDNPKTGTIVLWQRSDGAAPSS